jgi:hypothetical protein
VPVVGEVKQVGSDLVWAQPSRRLVEVLGKAGDASDVGFDGVGLVPMQGHVVDHSLAQSSHGKLLS